MNKTQTFSQYNTTASRFSIGITLHLTVLGHCVGCVISFHMTVEVIGIFMNLQMFIICSYHVLFGRHFLVANLVKIISLYAFLMP